MATIEHSKATSWTLTKKSFLSTLDFREHDVAVHATERYGDWIDAEVKDPPLVHGPYGPKSTTSENYLVIVSDDDDNQTEELHMTSAAYHASNGWIEEFTLEHLEGVVCWLQPSQEARDAREPIAPPAQPPVPATPSTETSTVVVEAGASPDDDVDDDDEEDVDDILIFERQHWAIQAEHVQQLLAESMLDSTEWISAKKRLPEKKDFYQAFLTHVEGDFKFKLAYWEKADSDDDWFFWGLAEHSEIKVSYWRPTAADSEIALSGQPTEAETTA